MTSASTRSVAMSVHSLSRPRSSAESFDQVVPDPQDVRDRHERRVHLLPRGGQPVRERPTAGPGAGDGDVLVAVVGHRTLPGDVVAPPERGRPTPTAVTLPFRTGGAHHQGRVTGRFFLHSRHATHGVVLPRAGAEGPASVA